MIVAAFVIDQETGATIATFGLEQEPEQYVPHRWMLARRYVVPAVGPGHHPWRDWIGALVILAAVFAVLWEAL